MEDKVLYRLLWVDNTTFAKVIIAVILVLLLLSSFITLWHLIRYWKENKAVRKVARRLIKWENDQKKTSDLKDPENRQKTDIIHQPTLDIDMLISGLSKKRAIYFRLSILMHLKKTRVKINVDVLQKLTRIAEAKKWTVSFPGFVMSLSMLLGMLGTFYGLTNMVGDIGTGLTEVDKASLSGLEKSLSGLDNALGGANAAFSTTLVGLVCTIFVSFYNYLLIQRQAVFFDILESVSTEKILPFTFPNLEEGTILDQISDRLKDSFEDFNGAIDQNKEVLDGLDGIYQRFEIIIRQVEKITTRESSTQLRDAVQSMVGLNTNLETLISEYRTQDILDEMKELEKTNLSFSKQYNRLLLDSRWIPSTRIILWIIVALLLVISGDKIYQVVENLINNVR
ncbi:MAG: hypothetical protein HEP71_30060 [Roseivirga sp.]|nr:hypothetical protein [Roseivirga sp.]